MVYVNRLRAKIEEDPAHPAYIQTGAGAGLPLCGIKNRLRLDKFRRKR